MILDQHGRPVSSQVVAETPDFEDYDWDFTDLHGSSDQVLIDAMIMNSGGSITEPDLLTDGDYPLFNIPDAVCVWAHKANGQISVRMTIEDWLEDDYQRRLKNHKDSLAAVKAQYGEKFREQSGAVWPIYCLDKYHYVYFMFAFNVHPDWDSKEFEKVLWREMKEAWVDIDLAPRF